MIILDTNVVSELVRTEPDVRVTAWVERQKLSDLALSVVTLSELRYGVSLLPLGKRRSNIERGVLAALSLFGSRFLDYDAAVSEQHGKLRAEARQNGRDDSTFDLMIAATALVNGAAIATRNVRDFRTIPELSVIDPWLD